MKIQIQKLSTETIKPSSKTPDHLKSYKLSFLDQINPPFFMPIVLFYPCNNTTFTTSDSISNKLKESLSETLSLYYPLAGRLVDNNFIDCNDDGITYVEAKANCNLSDIINDPVPQEFNEFLPFDLDDVRDFSMMMIQITFFECGGFAIAIGMSHKAGDAWSILLFINSWAATARGGGADVLSPVFISDSLFPAKDISGFNPRTGMVKLEEVITKRFVFTASKISQLRDKCTDTGKDENCRRPTRIEALSAFIWKRYILSTQSETDIATKIYTLLHAVNMRTRIDSPSSDRYFGNISRPAIAVPSLREESGGGYYNIVEKIREAISDVNDDYVKKLGEGGGHLSFLKSRAKDVNKGEVASFRFTSLCRFPLYEADFGLGKPVWVGSARLAFSDLVCFLDSLNEGDIEAWVSLKWEDMDKFERDEELLSYVS